MKSSNEISRAIFAYLNAVKNGKNISDDELLKASKSDGGKSYRVEHRMLTDRVVDGRTMKNMPQTSTFTSMMGKRSADDSESSYTNPFKKFNILRWKPGKVLDAFNKVTVNPLGRALATGAILGGGTYLLGPTATRLMGQEPVGYDRKTGDPVYMTKKDRRDLGWLSGLGAASIMALAAYNPDKGFSSLLHYPGHINKDASMLGEMDAVPLGLAQEAIWNSNKLTPWMKSDAMTMLNAIPGDAQTPITSTDMVNAAVNTGISGLHRFPVARVAAATTADYITALGVGKLIGMDKPNRLAIPTALMSLGLRTL